jgi:hypothetical protein
MLYCHIEINHGEVRHNTANSSGEAPVQYGGGWRGSSTCCDKPSAMREKKCVN